MAPRVNFRIAEAADATTIAALAVQVFLDTYATAGVRPDLAREAFHEYSAVAFADRLTQVDRRFILAEQVGEPGAGFDDGLVGFAELLCSATPAPAGSVIGAELVRLYVQPQAQGKALGRQLLERAEQLAVEQGQAAIWLTAWDGNARALAFYGRMGYLDQGSTTYTFQGRGYGNRVLARAVSPSFTSS